jgi:glutaminyl-peptide cyclotransferase
MLLRGRPPPTRSATFVSTPRVPYRLASKPLLLAPAPMRGRPRAPPARRRRRRSCPAAVTGSVSLSLAAAVLAYALTGLRLRGGGGGGGKGSERMAQPLRAVEAAPLEVRRAVVVRQFAHDTGAFTQGLAWGGEGKIYESTGLRGRSSVRRVDLETGFVERAVELKAAEFGEGCCVVGGELVQVLWKTGVGRVYSLPDLEELRSFRFEGDGWGLAVDRRDDRLLYLSDGSDIIRVLRRVLVDDEREDEGGGGGGTAGLEEIRRFTVLVGDANGKSVRLLNELEMVGDELWANIWLSELVARIDVSTGFVTGWVDMRGLLTPGDIPAGHNVDVLNGLAWDAESGRIFATGKLWPHLFEIQVSDEVSSRSLKYLNPFFTDPAKCRMIMASTVGQ